MKWPTWRFTSSCCKTTQSSDYSDELKVCSDSFLDFTRVRVDVMFSFPFEMSPTYFCLLVWLICKLFFAVNTFHRLHREHFFFWFHDSYRFWRSHINLYRKAEKIINTHQSASHTQAWTSVVREHRSESANKGQNVKLLRTRKLKLPMGFESTLKQH